MTIEFTGLPPLPDLGDELTFNTLMQNLFAWVATRDPGSFIEQLESIEAADYFSVQANPTDDRAGYIMVNGGHGLGGDAVAIPDLNTATKTSFRLYDAGTLNRPLELADTGVAISISRPSGFVQMAIDVVGKTASRGRRTGGFSPWQSPSAAGEVSHFARGTPPAGWLECNGGWVAKATYPALWAAIGGAYGSDANNFAVPDLRGEFIRGWDHGRGVDSGRSMGSWQDQMFKSHTHGHTNGGQIMVGNTVGGRIGFDGGGNMPRVNTTTLLATGGNETRPRNIALLPCIRY